MSLLRLLVIENVFYASLYRIFQFYSVLGRNTKTKENRFVLFCNESGEIKSRSPSRVPPCAETDWGFGTEAPGSPWPWASWGFCAEHPVSFCTGGTSYFIIYIYIFFFFLFLFQPLDSEHGPQTHRRELHFSHIYTYYIDSKI